MLTANLASMQQHAKSEKRQATMKTKADTDVYKNEE